MIPLDKIPIPGYFSNEALRSPFETDFWLSSDNVIFLSIYTQSPLYCISPPTGIGFAPMKYALHFIGLAFHRAGTPKSKTNQSFGKQKVKPII